MYMYIIIDMYILVLDIFPNSSGNKRRSPVPSKVRLRLADEVPFRVVEVHTSILYWVGIGCSHTDRVVSGTLSGGRRESREKEGG